MPRVFLNKLAAFFFLYRKKTIENDLFISYLPSSSSLTCMEVSLSFSNHMRRIIKTEPTSRWSFSLYMIFGKQVLCTETEWRWMFISNRSVWQQIQSKLCIAVQICNLASKKWKMNPGLLRPLINYPTALGRVQIMPKTRTNITRYLHSRGPVRQVSCYWPIM